MQKMIVSSPAVSTYTARIYGDLHHFGLILLYWGPSILIMRPRMTKFAAKNGVGAMMVQDILKVIIFNNRKTTTHG
jgi:hypothetical protein